MLPMPALPNMPKFNFILNGLKPIKLKSGNSNILAITNTKSEVLYLASSSVLILVTLLTTSQSTSPPQELITALKFGRQNKLMKASSSTPLAMKRKRLMSLVPSPPTALRSKFGINGQTPTKPKSGAWRKLIFNQ